jgi:proteasome lid subunit RPN8/RPN11
VEKIVHSAGRKPDEVSGADVIFGDFFDDEKAAAFARRLTKAGFVTYYQPRPKMVAEGSGGMGHGGGGKVSPDGYTIWKQSRDYLYGWNWRKDGAQVQGQGYSTKKSAIDAAIEHATGKRDDYGQLKSSAAEDSAPAPCSQTRRTIDGGCVRLAKEIGPIKSDRELYRLLAPSMKKETQEVFQVVCVDVHGDLVGYTEVARGQVSRVAVDIEDVLGAVLAVRPRPTAFAVAHCHPSGKARPSQADRRLTEEIRAAAKAAMPNTVFMDHLVIGGGNSNEYYSFSDGKVKRA